MTQPRQRRRWWPLLLAPVVMVAAGGALLIALVGGMEAAEAAPPGCQLPGDPWLPGEGPTGPGLLPGVDGEQYANAETIVATGLARGLPEYGLVVALAAALQESWLYNLDYGHADSLGLFQQRPSAGWGTPEQILDPVYSSTAFFGGPDVPPDPPGLLDIAGWQQMTVTEAAQAVQVSAFPNAYADDETLARALVAAITGTGGGMCGPPGAMDCPPSGLEVERGLTPDAVRVVRCVVQTWQITDLLGVGDRPDNPESDHASGRAVDVMIADWQSETGNALGWQVAEWARVNAAALGVSYLIFDDRIWSVARAEEGWRDYTHPAGCTTPTCEHRDHLHNSVFGDAAGGTGGAWVLPVPAGSYTLTAEFGECSGLWEGCHTGLDFAAPTGTPVAAVGSGTVSTVEPDQGGPYGNLVTLDHGAGASSWYAHLDSIAAGLVPGQRITAGAGLGTVGATGNVTGPHLHLEVRQGGIPIDPAQWLVDHGVTP